MQTKSKNGLIHESVVFTEIAKLFNEVEKIRIENVRLKEENQEYYHLQEFQGQFIFIDAMPDLPIKQHVVDIVLRHNRFCN